jgi:hypothetical protein
MRPPTGVSYTNGNLQIDIDPNNPNLFGGSDVASALGHTGNGLSNRLTGRDSNYNNIASQLGINISKCP